MRIALLVTTATALTSTPTWAAFFVDSKASIELRNFYLNQDQRQSNSPQAKAEEWAQGFILKYESGYTEGAIGAGVDAIGMLGVKLDSSPDKAGTGLLTRGTDGRAGDDYSELGMTAKLRASKSTLKVGTLLPKVPVVQYNDTRLLPQTFTGAWLNSAELRGLSFDLARLEKVSHRDSTNDENLQVTTGIKRNVTVSGSGMAKHFDLAGGTYQWSPSLSTSYYYAELDDLYRQHYAGLTHTLALGEGQSLKTDLRWADSQGNSATNIDNRMLNGMVTYRTGGHAFGVAYQRMSGDTGYAYIRGTDPYLVNFVQLSDFANKDEKSWQVRYDYDFAALGVPGLSFMTRYLYGTDIDTLTLADKEGHERERDMDIAYVIQSGPLKNLGIKWRNAALRSNFGRALDENRLILSYTLPLW